MVVSGVPFIQARKGREYWMFDGLLYRTSDDARAAGACSKAAVRAVFHVKAGGSGRFTWLGQFQAPLPGAVQSAVPTVSRRSRAR
jgi:hypothetical protein